MLVGEGEMTMSNELLSAVLDGECSDRELDQFLAECERDPALRRAYARHSQIRAGLGGVQFRSSHNDFSEAVFSALAAEAPVSVDDKVVPIFQRRRQWLRPAAGFAVAASLLAAVLLVWSPNTQPPELQTAATTEAPLQVANVAVSKVARAGSQPMRWAQAGSANAQQVSAYVMDYSNTRTVQGFSGALGYARLAAHAGGNSGALVKTVAERR